MVQGAEASDIVSMDESKAVANNLTELQLTEYIVQYLQSIEKDGTKVIALVGGPASGKGTLAERLVTALGNSAFLSTDNYLKGDRSWRRANVEDVGRNPILKYDFDFLQEQIRTICQLQSGQTVGVPIYDEETGIAISDDPENRPDPNMYKKKVGHVNYLLVEGDFQPLERGIVDRIIYLDVPDEIRLENRVYRDLQTRGETDREKVVNNFNGRQQTQFLPHTLPLKSQADMVISVNAIPLPTPTPERKFDYTFNIKQR